MKEELDRRFDSKIKELIDSYQEPIGDDLWGDIEGRLDKKYTFTLYRYIGYAAVAAALVFGVVLGVNRYYENELHSGYTALAVVDYSKISTSQDHIPSIEFSKPNIHLKKLNVRDICKTPSSTLQVKEDESILESNEGESTSTAVVNNTLREDVASSEEIYDNSWIYQIEEDEVTSNRRVVLGLSSNMLALSSDVMPNSRPQYAPGSNMNIRGGIVPITKPSFSIPLTFGLQAQYPVSDFLAIGLGVNYTFLKSSYQALIDNSSQGMVEESLHYIGVPISLYVNILKSNSFQCYFDGGVAIEKGVKMSSRIEDIFSGVQYRSGSVQGLQYSANVGIGVQYLFNDLVGIYFDPSLVYFFNSNQPFSIRTAQPLQLELELGLRFNL